MAQREGSGRLARWKVAALGVGALALVGLGGVTIRVQLLRADKAKLSKTLDGELAAFRERQAQGKGYAPAPLRASAAPIDDNGLALQRAAVRGLDVPEALFGTKDGACVEPTPEALAWTTEHATALDALRTASRATKAFTEVALEDGASAPLPEYRSFSLAHRALLARAASAPPGECLAVAADTLRLAQQIAPGAALTGIMMSAHQQTVAAEALLGCTEGASAVELAQAARELAQLAAEQPHLGASDALEVEYLWRAATLRSSIPLTGAFPSGRADWEAITFGGTVLEAWSATHEGLAAVRGIGAGGYPAAADAWRALDAREKGTNNALLMLAPEVDKLVVADQKGVAAVRSAALVMDSLARRAGASDLPAPSLLDPFSGDPLRIDAGATPRAWAVGPNKQDDAGAGDDVAVTARAGRSLCPKR